MRLCGALLKSPIPKQIEYYSRFSPSPLSIKQFLDFGEWRGRGVVVVVLECHGGSCSAQERRGPARGGG